MAKRGNRLINSIKLRVAADMRGIHGVRFFLPVIFSLLCGCTVVFGNLRAATTVVLIFPPFTPPLFILSLFRIFIFILLGAALGVLLGKSGHGKCDRVRGYSAGVMLFIIGEIIWLELLYCAAAPFLAFVGAAIMLLYALYLLILLRHRCYTLSLILSLYLAVLIARVAFSLCLIGLN